MSEKAYDWGHENLDELYKNKKFSTDQLEKMMNAQNTAQKSCCPSKAQMHFQNARHQHNEY